MVKKELSIIKNNDDEDEFWMHPKYMVANKARFLLLSTAVKSKACAHLMSAM